MNLFSCKTNVYNIWQFAIEFGCVMLCFGSHYTVKPVYNDHLYNDIFYLWFIQ